MEIEHLEVTKGDQVEARGRNGIFVPSRIGVYKNDAVTEMFVSSRRLGNSSPISLALLPQDADKLGRLLLVMPEPSFFDNLWLYHECIVYGESEYGCDVFIRAENIETVEKEAWEQIMRDHSPDDIDKPYTDYMVDDHMEFHGDYREFKVEDIRQVRSFEELIQLYHIPQPAKEVEHAGVGSTKE
jgi:hypothetical protein